MVLVKFIIDVLVWFILQYSLLVILEDDLINCMLYDSIVIFLYTIFVISCTLLSVVLSRPAFRVLRTEVSQYLTFVWLTSKAMDETSEFGYILRIIYIPLPALYNALANIWVSSSRGILSSIFPDDTSTVGIFPSMFFIRRLYNNFINRLWYFHVFKHV